MRCPARSSFGCDAFGCFGYVYTHAAPPTRTRLPTHTGLQPASSSSLLALTRPAYEPPPACVKALHTLRHRYRRVPPGVPGHPPHDYAACRRRPCAACLLAPSRETPHALKPAHMSRPLIKLLERRTIVWHRCVTTLSSTGCAGGTWRSPLSNPTRGRACGHGHTQSSAGGIGLHSGRR